MKRALSLALLLAVVPVSGPDNQTAPKQLLQRLADAPGPPGAEEAVRAIMVAGDEALRHQPHPLRRHGLRHRAAGHARGPRIMIDAHMDELGGMVRRITPNGFLTMQMLGGWLDQALVDQRWIIIGSKGPVHAVTGIRDIHVVTPDERTAVFSARLRSTSTSARRTAAEVAAMGIAARRSRRPRLALHRRSTAAKNYLGKAWDDRIGCAVLLEAMRRTATMPHPNQLFYVATTQEEIGLRGATHRLASRQARPRHRHRRRHHRRHSRRPPRRDPGQARRRPRHVPLRLQRHPQPQARRLRPQDRQPTRASRSRPTSSRATATTPPRCR